MKFTLNCIFAAFAVSQTSAFQAPQSFGGRGYATRLAVTTLENWQLLDNGSVVGSVRGHPTLNDGDIITTSPLANPGQAASMVTVSTMTGSEYMLGTPMQVRRASPPAESGTVDRSTVIKGAGIASLIAGGFALGLGVGGGIGGPQPMTVPEVRSMSLGCMNLAITLVFMSSLYIVIFSYIIAGQDCCCLQWSTEQ